jgi:hypothetical protein
MTIKGLIVMQPEIARRKLDFRTLTGLTQEQLVGHIRYHLSYK